MALILALIETSVLFTAVSGTVLLWARPILVDWIDVMTVLGQGLAVSLCCVVAFYYNDLYDLHIVRSFGGFASRLLQSFGVAFILLAFFYALFPGARIVEGVFVSSLVTVVGFLLPLRAISYIVMRSRAFIERVLILGTGALSQKLVAEIEARPECGYAIAGIIDDGATSGARPESGPPVLGPANSLQKIVEDERVDRIIVAMAERRGRLPMDQLLAVRVQSGIMVEDGAEVYERLTEKLAVESLTPSALIFSKDFRKSRLDLAVSRSISLLASVAGLIVLSPLFGLIALAIKLESPGPVFFVQPRAGRQGRDFRLIKFRTMRPAAGQTSEWAADNDDRVTRVGKWLRKFRLDELPQLVNVLRGDMNLVGPRPHPVSNYQLFIEQIPYYALRSVVRPGVTGWAQVRHGYANNLEEETEKMRYDLYYIKHLSLWFDLRILFDTVKIVLFGRGATRCRCLPRRSESGGQTMSILDRIEDKTARIAVLGQGYVGLPLAVAFACSGFRVTGLDTAADRIDALQRGESYIPDVPSEQLQEVVQAGRFRATSDVAVLAEQDVVIICVPTPLRKSRDPDISHVVAAAEDVARHLRPPQLIVLESTTYPGHDRGGSPPAVPAWRPPRGRGFLPVLFARADRSGEPRVRDQGDSEAGGGGHPGLHAGGRSAVPPDRGPGLRAVVAHGGRAGQALREHVPECQHRPRQRDGADLPPPWRECVGGHPGRGDEAVRLHAVLPRTRASAATAFPWTRCTCLAGAAQGLEPKLIGVADEINRTMPEYVFQLVTDALNERGKAVKGARILVLGVAYKRGVGDMRESPAYEIMEELIERGAQVQYADPFVPTLVIHGQRLEAAKLERGLLRWCDIALILTDHREFDYETVVTEAPLVVDTRNATRGLAGHDTKIVRL